LEEELVRSLKHGSPGEVAAAVAEVHSQYGQRLLHLARRVVGDQAEDVYYAVLADLPRRIQSFSPRRDGSFGGWLATCVHRAAIDAWRREKRQEQREAPHAEFSQELLRRHSAGTDCLLPDDPGEAVAEREERNALRQQVREILGQLSDDDRDILAAVDMAGLSPSEYAALNGILPETARQRLSRARERFRKLAVRCDHIRAWLAGKGSLS